MHEEELKLKYQSLYFPLILSASDYVEAVLDNVNDSDATVKKGYFSVVKLH